MIKINIVIAVISFLVTANCTKFVYDTGLLRVEEIVGVPFPRVVPSYCLQCVCEAASDCDSTAVCNGEVCGLLRITYPYWHDSGRPTVAGENPDSPYAYAHCANDPICAARAFDGYMTRFAQDCNGDLRIDCYDYASIHLFGGYGCRNRIFPDIFKHKVETCLKEKVTTLL